MNITGLFSGQNIAVSRYYNVTGNSLTLTDLLRGTNYSISIAARSENVTTSAFSDPQTFQTCKFTQFFFDFYALQKAVLSAHVKVVQNFYHTYG